MQKFAERGLKKNYFFNQTRTKKSIFTDLKEFPSIKKLEKNLQLNGTFIANFSDSKFNHNSFYKETDDFKEIYTYNYKYIYKYNYKY